MSDLRIKTASSVRAIDADAWNQLSNDMPFQSHQWYVFGETVMDDCPPMYILAYDEDHFVARTCLWLVRNEPMPKMLGPFRKAAAMIFKRHPLLISRSPLSYTTGLVLADETKRAEILSVFANAALEFGRTHQASFILFDYLDTPNAHDWPRPFSSTSTPDPGTYMENSWNSMDEYLASGSKKDRQHYKRVLREAEKIGIRIDCHQYVENVEAALHLIRNVEQNHGALPNPWARRMLENMEMVNGSFLTAKINNQLVGCGLIFEDNASQMTSALGLVEDIPYVYFMLVYESLKMAFEHRVHSLRWGSGAYDVKQRLGFSLENNNALAFAAVHPGLQKLLQWSL